MKNITRFIAIAGVATLGAMALPAVLIYNLNTIYTGGTPGGPAPWVTITMSDIVANKVNVLVEHSASSTIGQFVSNVYLNLDPFVSGITLSNEVNANKRDNHNTALNGINGGAGQTFDLEINFITSNSGGGVNRLKPGEFWSGNLTGTGLSTTNFISANKDGYFAAAKIQGIDGGAISSHFGVVPEPATLLIFSVGVTAILHRRRRK